MRADFTKTSKGQNRDRGVGCCKIVISIYPPFVSCSAEYPGLEPVFQLPAKGRSYIWPSDQWQPEKKNEKPRQLHTRFQYYKPLPPPPSVTDKEAK